MRLKCSMLEVEVEATAGGVRHNYQQGCQYPLDDRDNSGEV
jgi:hypothetical protein